MSVSTRCGAKNWAVGDSVCNSVPFKRNVEAYSLILHELMENLVHPVFIRVVDDSPNSLAVEALMALRGLARFVAPSAAVLTRKRCYLHEFVMPG